MSRNSKISVSNRRRRYADEPAVHERITSVMRAYQAIAKLEKERKKFMAFSRKDAGKASNPKGRESVNAKTRMYLQNEKLLPEHGEEGRNIHRRVKE